MTCDPKRLVAQAYDQIADTYLRRFGESAVRQFWLEQLIAALPAGDVIAVAHAGTIRAALVVALEMPPDKALSFVIDPLSLTRLDRLDNDWRVVAVNRI